MEAENAKNARPVASSKLPAVTLAVLLAMILALLYIGYDYMTDDTGGSEELTNVALDTTDQRPLAMQSEGDELMIAPDEEPDTAGTPAPVDLSQATPPADETIGRAEASENSEGEDGATKTKAPIDRDALAKAERAKEAAEAKRAAEKKAEEKRAEAPRVAGASRTHTVAKGETFYAVANRYGLKVSTLKAMNPNVSENEVKAGVTKLNVKVRAVHTVGPGDVLRVVAEKYGVSKEALMRANGKTKDYAQRGEKLVIPYADKQ